MPPIAPNRDVKLNTFEGERGSGGETQAAVEAVRFAAATRLSSSSSTLIDSEYTITIKVSSAILKTNIATRFTIYTSTIFTINTITITTLGLSPTKAK